jgi:hypothetical protein
MKKLIKAIVITGMCISSVSSAFSPKDETKLLAFLFVPKSRYLYAFFQGRFFLALAFEPEAALLFLGKN